MQQDQSSARRSFLRFSINRRYLGGISWNIVRYSATSDLDTIVRFASGNGRHVNCRVNSLTLP